MIIIRSTSTSIQRVPYCSTNSLLHLSIWLCPSPHPSPPSMSTWKRGNSLHAFSGPLTSQEPHSAVPHQTFILSLCLSEIITASPVIGRKTVMDVWCFCFRVCFFSYCIFALFIVTPPPHHSKRVAWNKMILFFFFFFFWKSLKVLFLDWQLVIVRQLKFHYFKCEEMRAHI